MEAKIYISPLTRDVFEQIFDEKEQEVAYQIITDKCVGMIYCAVIYREGQLFLSRYPTVNVINVKLSIIPMAELITDVTKITNVI